MLLQQRQAAVADAQPRACMQTHLCHIILGQLQLSQVSSPQPACPRSCSTAAASNATSALALAASPAAAVIGGAACTTLRTAVGCCRGMSQQLDERFIRLCSGVAALKLHITCVGRKGKKKK